MNPFPPGHTVCVPPSATVHTEEELTSRSKDDEYIISTNIDMLFQRHLAIPHSTVPIADKVTYLLVVSISRAPQTVPKDMTLAVASSLHEYRVSLLQNDEDTCAAPSQHSHMDTAAVEAMTDSFFDYLPNTIK